MKLDGNCSVSGSLVPATRAWRVERPSEAGNRREDSRRYPARTVTISRTGAQLRTSPHAKLVIDAEQQLLQPAFVAQVLGQILRPMPDNRRAAAHAYAMSSRKNPNPQFAEVA
jgi:hypothetical protein